MTRHSLRLRLFVAGALAIGLATFAAVFALGLLFERHVERRIDAELGAHLDQLTAAIEFDAAGVTALTTEPADPRFRRPLSGLYWQIVIDDGATVLRSRSLWDQALALPPDVLAPGVVHRHVLDGPAGGEVVVLERRVTADGREIRAAVALDRAEQEAARRAFMADLGPYLAMLATLLLVASAAQIQVGLRPLAVVRARLAEIRSGRRERLAAGFPSEVQPLADEVDALLEARARQVAEARARAGDLAHGLKTPLQVLAGDAHRLRAKGETALADEIDAVTAAMRRHVDRELARARLAAGNVHGRADVRAVAERVVAVVARTPGGGELAWDIVVPPGTSARIDADDLAEALGNLVENAARHALRHVRLESGAASGMLALSVVDDGPGIAPADREAALSRGGRLDERGSAGLGLAIVQDIAAAWGGRLELDDAAPGLEARLLLPVAD